ncbi:hypothetical protein ABHI18_006692 [Aspergillus niger]
MAAVGTFAVEDNPVTDTVAHLGNIASSAVLRSWRNSQFLQLPLLGTTFGPPDNFLTRLLLSQLQQSRHAFAWELGSFSACQIWKVS